VSVLNQPNDVSNDRGPNPKGRDELNAGWDSDAALSADGAWCRRCQTYRVEGVYGTSALCPSCLGGDKDVA
jgi:hypothetical protein